MAIRRSRLISASSVVVLLALPVVVRAAVPDDLARQAKRLAAQFTGVPVEQLVRAGPDRVLVPAHLAPPYGTISRTWTPSDHYSPEPNQPRLKQVTVTLGRMHVLAFWDPPAGAKPSPKPLSKSKAIDIAREFLKSRNLLAGLKLVDVTEQGGTPGKPQAYSIKFAGATEKWNAVANITVDARYGYVSAAGYSRRDVISPEPPPKLSLAEARQKVKAAAAARGIQIREIKGRLNTSVHGFPQGYPVYEFSVYGVKKQGNALVAECQGWYVDGLTGRVGTADDFPQIREWNKKFREWMRQQRNDAH